MNELELRKEFELLIPDGYVELAKIVEENKIRLQVMEDILKERGEAFLKENNLDKFEYGKLEIGRTKDFVKKVVDTKRMKEEGVYELHTRDSNIKGHVYIKVKYDD